MYCTCTFSINSNVPNKQVQTCPSVLWNYKAMTCRFSNCFIKCIDYAQKLQTHRREIYADG